MKPSRSRWIDWGSVALTIGLAVVALIYLRTFARTAILFTDECWHALVSIVTASEKSLVTTTTFLMADSMPIDYPPLFHVVAATAYTLGGAAIFPYLNLAIAAGLLGLILASPGKVLDPLQRATMVMVLLATPLFVMYSIRFYTEMLTALIFFCSWWWLAQAYENGYLRHAVYSGIATGLLIWTKQTGFVVLAIYAAILGWTLLRRDSRWRTIAWVVGIATLFATCYLIFSFIKGENVMIFAFPTKNIALWSAEKIYVSYNIFFKTLRATYGTLNLVLLALPFIVLLDRRRKEYCLGFLLVTLVLLVALFLIDRRLVERHTLFLLPLATFLGIDAVKRVAGRAGVQVTFVIAALLAVWHITSMPNYRINFNPSRELMQMNTVIAERTEPDALILTRWWSEVRYYTGRRVIWPVSNLEDPPVELFSEQVPEKWLDALHARHIDYVVIDDRHLLVRPGFDFSRSSLLMIDRLIERGRIAPIARFGPLRLFKIL